MMLLFLFLTKTKTFSDLRKIRTINITTVFISANMVWLLLIPGTYWYYMFRGARGDYPPFADSIGIPIMTQIPVYLILLIPLNLFLFLTTVKTTLPSQLFSKPEVRNWQQALGDFFGCSLLVNILLFISLVIDGDHFSIPVNLFFTYILLTLRAGQIKTKADVPTLAYPGI